MLLYQTFNNPKKKNKRILKYTKYKILNDQKSTKRFYVFIIPSAHQTKQISAIEDLDKEATGPASSNTTELNWTELYDVT